MRRIFISEERVQQVASEVMKHLNATDPYAKTVIFCENVDHAERMRVAVANAAKQLVMENSKYVVRITGHDNDGNYELRKFVDPESRYPVIVTTSKLLSVGVDVRTCKLIVLDQTIKSMSTFQQIIGLGSRIAESHNKYFFTIMDFRGVTERFGDDGLDGELIPDDGSFVDDDSESSDFEPEESTRGEDIHATAYPNPNPFPPSWAETWGEDEYGLFADLYYKNITQRFRWIAAGDFLMGSSSDEPERRDWEDQHKVNLTQGYWLADTAVTRKFWSVIMGENPSRFNQNKNNPVERVSWKDCQSFILRLNTLFLHLDGLVFHLPTEAEWEHACRAGTITPFSFGENITSSQVNFNGFNPYNDGQKSESRGKTLPVESLPANQWGLYEMHGNVWEWCADTWQQHSGTQTAIDPYHGGGDSTNRVRRGGSWAGGGRVVRSAYRNDGSPDGRYDNFGFRLSLGYEFKARSTK